MHEVIPMAKQRKTDNQTQAQADKINKRVKDRDKLTMGKIVTLADDVSKSAFKGGDIAVAIPARTRSNTLWNKKRGILQMGDGKASRELFNLNQAKQFMQTVLHGKSIKELIEAEKTLSLRGMFYKALHTIQGTSGEKTFAAQDESDAILEDLEDRIRFILRGKRLFAARALDRVQRLVEHSAEAQRLLRLDQLLDALAVQHRLHELLRLVQVKQLAARLAVAHLQDAALLVPQRVRARARRDRRGNVAALEGRLRHVVGQRDDLAHRQLVAILDPLVDLVRLGLSLIIRFTLFGHGNYFVHGLPAHVFISLGKTWAGSPCHYSSSRAGLRFFFFAVSGTMSDPPSSLVAEAAASVSSARCAARDSTSTTPSSCFRSSVSSFFTVRPSSSSCASAIAVRLRASASSAS